MNYAVKTALQKFWRINIVSNKIILENNKWTYTFEQQIANKHTAMDDLRYRKASW